VSKVWGASLALDGVGIPAGPAPIAPHAALATLALAHPRCTPYAHERLSLALPSYSTRPRAHGPAFKVALPLASGSPPPALPRAQYARIQALVDAQGTLSLWFFRRVCNWAATQPASLHAVPSLDVHRTQRVEGPGGHPVPLTAQMFQFATAAPAATAFLPLFPASTRRQGTASARYCSPDGATGPGLPLRSLGGYGVTGGFARLQRPHP
jgi:hypothetical protein